MARRPFGHGLDHAFETVHRTRRFRHEGRPPVFVGVLLLGFGVLFLLDNLNVIETRDFIRTFWPLLVIGWGAGRLVSGRGGDRVVGGLAVFFGGILLGNRLFDWDVNLVSVLWPLILIALGISILSRAWRQSPADASAQATVTEGAPGGAAGQGRVDASSLVKEFVVMGGIERKNVSQTFQGGDVTVVMGAVELDLRECRMASDEARVSVLVALGEVAFRIPREWTVDSRLSHVMANLEDRSEPPLGAPPKRFVIEGSAFMGNVEIRN